MGGLTTNVAPGPPQKSSYASTMPPRSSLTISEGNDLRSGAIVERESPVRMSDMSQSDTCIDCGPRVRDDYYRVEPQEPSNIVVLSMGGVRGISKAGFGRTARFGNSLPLLSHLAALESRRSRQGTRSDRLNRCHRCAGLRTAFASILGTGDHCIRSCVFLVS